MPSSERCGNCRFFKQLDGMPSGRCRRFPPVLIGDKHSSTWSHPFVKDDAWCGEWKAAPTDQPKPARERLTD
jgi:hypothetical protein